MLELKDVTIRRGPLQVVHGVSLAVERGEVVSIIGTNGAGKSSLMLAIAGLLKTAGGEVRFEGTRIDELSAEQRSHRGIALVPEGRWLFPDLTVEQHLRLGAFHKPLRTEAAKAMAEVYALFPRLAERRNQVVSTLSGGEQQMVSIGRALMTRPKILLLDEPSIGLAPIVVTQMFDALRTIVATGLTVLVVEQNVEEALHFSQRGYVLSNGRFAFEGKAAELLADPRVAEAYLTGAGT